MRSDFGVPWDSDRMKFFFLIYEKGGAFYVQVFPQRPLLPLCAYSDYCGWHARSSIFADEVL
jgi:hypothetical protein